jgi:hypothetical protein
LPKLKLPSGAKRDRPVAVGAVDRDADERALVEFDPAA